MWKTELICLQGKPSFLQITVVLTFYWIQMHFNTFISNMKLKFTLNRLLVTSRLTSGAFYSPGASVHLPVVAASVCSLYFLEPWQSLDTCHYSVPPPDAQCPCRWMELWAYASWSEDRSKKSLDSYFNLYTLTWSLGARSHWAFYSSKI